MAYTETNANKTSGFASLLNAKPYIRKVWADTFKQLPTFFPEFLNVDNSNQRVEIENTTAGRPEWSSQTEAAQYSFGDYAQGTEVTYTAAEFAEAFDVSLQMLEDNQWKPIMSSAKELARGGYSKAETDATAILNNAFTSGTGADSSYLCVSNHNLIGSGSTGDNALTTVLGSTGLEEAYVLADTLVQESNIYVPGNFTTLVVPPALRKTAEELVRSDLSPHNSNNAINVHRGYINKIVVTPYLSSSTAWFLVDPSSERKGQFFWRIKPQFLSKEDQYSLNHLFIGRERYSTGHTNWQGIIGSTGTT